MPERIRLVNYAVRETEAQARRTAWQDALNEYRILAYDPAKDPFQNTAAWDDFGDSLPIVWLPAEKNPFLRPPGGVYSSGKSYSRETDLLWGNFEGMAHVVLRDIDGTVLEYIGFQVPSKCLKCARMNLCRPIVAGRRAPFCKVDGQPCGKRIVEGCNDFLESLNED